MPSSLLCSAIQLHTPTLLPSAPTHPAAQSGSSRPASVPQFALLSPPQAPGHPPAYRPAARPDNRGLGADKLPQPSILPAAPSPSSGCAPNTIPPPPPAPHLARASVAPADQPSD